MSTLYKRKKIYHIQFYKDGKQVRKSLKTTVLNVARQIQKQIDKDLALGRYDIEDSRQDCPIEDFRERYFAWAEENKRPKTVLTEKNFFDQFVESTGIKTLGEATREDVEQFRLSRKRKGWKPASVNSAVNAVRAIYNYAIQWGLTEHNPVKGVKHFKREKNPPKFLAREEFENVLSIAERQGRDIHWVFALGIYAGLRKNEIANARWEWFDFKRKLVTLSSHGGFKLKDSETRTIPLNSTLASILEHHVEREGYLFIPEKEHDATFGYRYDFRKEFQAVCEEAGVPWVTPHVLRHTFASQLATAGVSLYKISQWLGHSDFKTTQIYAHLQASDDDIDRL